MKTEDFLARLQASGALPSRREAERRAKAGVSALAQMLPDAESCRHFAAALLRRQRETTVPGVAKRREEAYAEAGA